MSMMAASRHPSTSQIRNWWQDGRLDRAMPLMGTGWLKLKKSNNLMVRTFSLHWQLALLTTLIIATYWHGIWAGAPRSDQSGYLHQVGQYKGLMDILLSAPSFNRTESAGDFLLYRPILYLQLGLSYFVFGYDFTKWQLFSLALHIWLVARLFLLFPSSVRQNSALPFLVCLAFATSVIASEQVLWNHMTGYLLYLHLTLSSLTYLQSHLSSKDSRSLMMSLAFATLAQFTYELGVINCILISCYLCWENFRSYWRRACLFFGCALSYPALSAYDLWQLGLWPTTPAVPEGATTSGLISSIAKLPEIAGLALFQLFFWFGGIFFPQVLNLTVDRRTRIDGLRMGERLSEQLSWLPDFVRYSQAELIPFFHVDPLGGYIFSINLAACAIIVCITARAIPSWSKTWQNGGWGTIKQVAIVPFLLLIAYSMLIAFGRTEPRGIHTLGNNLYYAYTAHFLLLASIIISIRESGPWKKIGQVVRHRHMLSAALAVLCTLNIYDVVKLTQQMRYDYSEPRQALIFEILEGIEAYEPDKRFVFSLENDCEISQNLDWLMGGHIRRNTGWQPPFTYLDALFPEYSANVMVNSGNLIEDIRTVRLGCPE